MNHALLKKIRVVLSLLFLTAAAVIFIDFTHALSVAFFNSVTYLQFVPSLLKFLATGAAVSVGFAVILLLTALLGRVYCSTVCPLGTLQDVFGYLSRAWGKKRKYRFSEPMNHLRYSLLVMVVALFIAGIILPLNLLDPFSIFGKIATQLFKPAAVTLNNLTASALIHFNIFRIYPVEIKGFRIAALILPVVMLGVVGWLSATKGRLYCNSICPVGSLLGFISRFSLLRIRIDPATCDHCGKCGTVCKASCIDIRKKEVDFSRCVGCYNCLAACPTNSLSFVSVFEKRGTPLKPEGVRQRRNFLFGVAAYLLGYAGIAYGQSEKYTKNTIPVLKKYPVSPPGSVGIKRFNETCTACNLCVSACPAQVLQPSWFEYGFAGMFQPRLDTVAGYCTYDCTICGDICPTGAILPLSPDEKRLTQIGKAKFIKKNCIVETQKTECGACSERCPTKAVHMIPYQGLFLPEVREQYCIGCGACEYACPTVPFKAIYVEGNAVHQRAEKPREEKTS